LNLTLDQPVWLGVVPVALEQGKDFGRSTMGGKKKVNVEYVSANPTGPLHVGHTRGAVFGDALASLLDFAGYAVTREYYINDGGAQVDVLARSAYLRYREALGEEIGEIPDGLYPGDYLKGVGAAIAARDGGLLRIVQLDGPQCRPYPVGAGGERCVGQHHGGLCLGPRRQRRCARIMGEIEFLSGKCAYPDDHGRPGCAGGDLRHTGQSA